MLIFTDEPVNASYGYVNVNSANMRSSPNKESSSNIIATLYYGQEFSVISCDGYWYYVNCNGT